MTHKITDRELIAFFKKYEAVLIADNLTGIPSEEELAQFSVPPEFDTKMQKAIDDYNCKSPATKSKRIGRKLLIGLVAALLAAAMTLTISSAAREWFMDIITEIFSDHTAVYYTPTEEQNDYPFLRYTPSFLPDGYELGSYDANEIVKTSRSIYVKDGGGKITISQHLKGKVNVDTESAENKKIMINGKDTLYSQKDGNQTLAWDNGQYHFLVIVSDESITKEDMVKIVESMEPEVK